MQNYHAIERAEQVMERYLDDLKALVNIDSGTYTKSGVDRVGAYLQERFHDFGFSSYVDSQQKYGNHLVATHKGTMPNGPRLLFIGHMDTVFPEGEAQRRPFTISERNGSRIATGPGVLDMKSGVLMGMYALHLLMSEQADNYQSVTFLCNSDEEIGSLSSKPLVQELARQADIALVLEPGRALHTIVSSRRGIGHYRVDVHGVATHAGVEPQRGRNAILELSYQVQDMQAINGTIAGTTLSVGIIHGGERTNVIPEFAFCEMDVRVSDEAGLHAIEAAMHNVTTKHRLDGTQITLSGGMHCMPFERSERSARLVQLVKEAGNDLGLKIEDLMSGGASDANNTAAVGIPTLDGLGAGGGLAHNPGEYVELACLPTRIALLTNLIEHIGNSYQL